MEIIYLISIGICLMYIWFDTDAFVEYTRGLKIEALKCDEYFVSKKNNPYLDYTTFLLMSYNNFFTRLISCPTCLGTWVGLIFSIIDFHNFALIGVNIIGIWTGYALLRFILRKLQGG